MVLTKVSTPIIGWVASILGWIINAVYAVLDMIGFPNIGLAIILFTIVVYLLMTPLQVKQALTGYGRASKTQIQQMMKSMLGLAEVPKPDDVADGLALAICHAHSHRLGGLLNV